MLKRDGKNNGKTLKNETVESWKSLVFLRKNIHFAKSARSQIGWKSHRKSHQKWCKNPSQNHTKFNAKSTCRKISEKYGQITEKGRKWSPKGTQKSTKSMQKLMPGKGRKKLKKIIPAAATLRRTKRAGNIIRATPPTHWLSEWSL